MSYLKIPNLYKDQTILMFRECYALEKIHGTSAHITFGGNPTKAHAGPIHFHPGGESFEKFKALFDEQDLMERFAALGYDKITIYGEAYGGKQQKQAWRYGPNLKFVAFDVLIGETWWQNVPTAANLCQMLGLEFVHYVRTSTDLSALDAERDAPSEQSRRNGVAGPEGADGQVHHPREGVVLRPLEEFMLGGSRVMAKHKRDDERETKTPRPVVDPKDLQVLTDARAIAAEWVTPTRLEHVIDRFKRGFRPGSDTVAIDIARYSMVKTDTGTVVEMMIEDVIREGAGEIVDSLPMRKEVGKATAGYIHQDGKR